MAPAYNATKSYQINYIEGLQKKTTKLNLSVFITDVRPGFVDTDMAKGDGKFWVSSVEKAAQQILRTIEKKKQVVYITKRCWLIAVFLKMLPRNIFKHFH
jgi:short-subunit dehydrogenase